MDQHPGTQVWAATGPLVVLVVAVLGVLGTLRWVPRGHLGVRLRRDRVRSVSGEGLQVGLPLVDRVVVVAEAPDPVDLVVRTTTADGCEVRVVVRAEARLVAPTPMERYVDALGAGRLAAEQVLARWVAGHRVADLPEALLDQWAEVTTAVDREARLRGLRVLDLELEELDVLLAGPALHRGPR
ncbi:hypothetical protein [Nocardioides sp. SYSU D00038]|uniref:hypothetical protein n=1 Tax=Nocardioides sp. SYSU D00038 TaxID=2812554 RepID=UPI001967B64B|nr:hypothetical protein [Nocardioides sp. SYSU D00038]